MDAGHRQQGPGLASVPRVLSQLVDDAARNGHARAAGTLAGLIVALPLVCVILAVPVVAALLERQRPSDVALDSILIAAIGLSIAVLAAASVPGALWGPRALGHQGIGRSDVLAMSGLGVLIGATCLVVGLGVVGASGAALSADAITDGALLWVVGVGLLGLPALVVVVPHVLAWRSLMADVRERAVAAAMDAVLGG